MLPTFGLSRQNRPKVDIHRLYTQWISSCIATAREQIPGSIANYVTGVSERSQKRGSLKDEVYNR